MKGRVFGLALSHLGDIMTLTNFPIGIDLVPGDTRTRCDGGLVIAGEHFQCDYAEDHEGWAHSNKKAQALWL